MRRRSYVLALLIASACSVGFAPIPSATASISSIGVSFGMPDSWAYTVNASWTTPGNACYDQISWSCDYLDSSGAVVISISEAVTPVTKQTSSPVFSFRSGTFNGASEAASKFALMNPKWKNRVTKCVYYYTAWVGVGDDTDNGSEASDIDVSELSPEITL